MPDHTFPRERYLASIVLAEVAGKASSLVDSLSTWLFVGYFAAVTFLLTRSDAVAAYLPKDWLHSNVSALLAMAALGIVQKSISIVVASGAAGAATGRKRTAPMLANGEPLHPEAILREVQRAVFWPASVFVRRSFKKVVDGDLAASSRTLVRLSQIQALLTLFQMLIVVGQLVKVANSAAF